MKFTEAKLEDAIIQLLEQQGYPHLTGDAISRKPEQVLITEDLRTFLSHRYGDLGITEGEITQIVRQLESLPASDLYDSNKQFCQWLADGFVLKREDPNQKDMLIQLLDYSGIEALGQQELDQDDTQRIAAEATGNYRTDSNIYKIVNQLEIEGKENKRIPDGILYVNGLPLVVFEFKSAIREETTIHEAFQQLTIRYRRDIPQLFVFNAFCVISDGVNNKMGSLFAPYEFFYGWRKVSGNFMYD